MDSSTPSLKSFVFSWTLKDVLNDHLYKNQVKEIPETFTSVDHYLSSYRYALLEETRAELSSNMKSLSQSPTFEILSVTMHEDYLLTDKLMYNIKFNIEKNSNDDKEIYIPQNYDVIIFSDVRPVRLKDLRSPRRSYRPALVVSIEDEDNPDMLVVLASKPILVEPGVQKRESLFGIFLINIKTNDRIWKALDRGNTNIINKMLQPNSLVEACSLLCSREVEGLSAQKLLKDLLSFNLNESQLDAVRSSITTSVCMCSNFVKLIWGPPGTGKTKTVGALLWSFLKLKWRTLTCAPTNVSVVEVTSRLMRLVRQTFRPDGYGLGDIVLFGNRKRLKIDDHDDLHDIFIDYRVERLTRCFAPLTGWYYLLRSMIWLLEDSNYQYDLYLEIKEDGKKEQDLSKKKIMEGVLEEKPVVTKEEQDLSQKKLMEGVEEEKFDVTKEEQDLSQEELMEGVEEDESDVTLTFREYVSKRFNFYGKELKFCLRCFLTQMPSSFIRVDVADKMNRVLRLLKTIKNLLHSSTSDGVELKEIFSKSGSMNDATGDPSTLLLSQNRNECLQILRFLDGAFVLPHFGGKSTISDFCLKNACLIFCTASSSARLDGTDDFKLVVIDEAAQLKECESTISLQLPGVRHAILIGDERQLPAMVHSKLSEKAGFGRSLFERLVSLGYERHLLNIQYRMHPSISLFPNSEFYNRRILDAPTVRERSYKKDLLEGSMYGPYSFINVSCGNDECDTGTSRKNMVEVAVVSEMVENLYKASVEKSLEFSVGVISPYKAQVFALVENLEHKYEGHANFSVSVRSVDGFQGGEEDVIIISTVRSNRNGSVGFLSNCRRTNVALTRARYCLWIVGNGTTLSSSGSVWEKLITDAKERECYFNAEEDKRLAKAVIVSMVELNQMDDLLKLNSLLFRWARWKVFLDDDFRKSFAAIRAGETRRAVLTLLLKLSTGWRHPPQKQDLSLIDGASSQLLEQYKVDGQLYLLWTVDIHKENSKYTQVLRFWDIRPARDIPRFVNQLNIVCGSYTFDNYNRCRLKCFEGTLVVPMSWEIAQNTVRLQKIGEADCADLSTQLASLSLHSGDNTTKPDPRGGSSQTNHNATWKGKNFQSY